MRRLEPQRKRQLKPARIEIDTTGELMWKKMLIGSCFLSLTIALVITVARPNETAVIPLKTNALAKVTIKELLQNKEHWNSNRVEVVGYYKCSFEYSVLTSMKGESSRQGIWVNMFRIAPNAKISQVSNAPARIIGLFRAYKGRGAGHLSMCPAEILNVELLEEYRTNASDPWP
jgi:hypothetical protein